MSEWSVTVQDVFLAMQNREIQVYYQPQHDVLTRQLTGAEALVRWLRPDGSVLMPGHFVPLMEQTDAICQLDWYVLERVCEFLKQYPEAAEHHIAVNFSRRHFADEDFLSRLNAIADAHSVEHSHLGVEITESAAVEHHCGVAAWVQKVRDAGYRVAMDDFGKGMSSLSFLKDIPLDVLKIDRGLLTSAGDDEKQRCMLESIFSFARRMHIVTVAEGVETPGQVDFLRASGCERMQGFLLGMALTPQEYAERCRVPAPEGADVLRSQSPASAAQMMLEVMFRRFPLIIMVNLTRNSYYMMAYENHTTRSCAATGNFDELIESGTQTMHPDDRAKFRGAFSRESLLAAHARGEGYVRAVTRQCGDDGVYRKVEIVDYFVENHSDEDVIAVTLCQPLTD